LSLLDYSKRGRESFSQALTSRHESRTTYDKGTHNATRSNLSQFSGGNALENQTSSTWNRPDFEEVGSGFEVTAYSNDWDQDRI
jgi:coenzyme PQQ precursor peptide PqqA